MIRFEPIFNLFLFNYLNRIGRCTLTPILVNGAFFSLNYDFLGFPSIKSMRVVERFYRTKKMELKMLEKVNKTNPRKFKLNIADKNMIHSEFPGIDDLRMMNDELR